MIRRVQLVDAGAFAPALGSIVLVDQALKAALVAAIPEGRALRLGSLVRIRPTRNPVTIGGALGIPRAFLPFLWLAILLLVLLVAPEAGLFETRLAWAALGAALGGAGSNLLDHLVRGGIVDYVDLRVWPPFNLADAAIVAGVLVALLAG
jgi:signal peptidase II